MTTQSTETLVRVRHKNYGMGTIVAKDYETGLLVVEFDGSQEPFVTDCHEGEIEEVTPEAA